MTANRNWDDENVQEWDEAAERRLNRALEAAPTVSIPKEFAARVAGLATASAGSRRPWKVARSNFGGYAAWIASAVLLGVVMVMIGQGGSFAGKQWFELGVEVEFAALTAWLGLRTRLQG